jgi:tetratricopeptide (TPR) repeat protein
MPFRNAKLVCPLLIALTAAGGRQGVDDPALRAMVERFFATQEAEDVEGYLSLWAKSATRPQPEQLKFIFDAGDDKYSNISVVSVFPRTTGVRVRVNASRERTVPSRVIGGAPRVYQTSSSWSLAFVREGESWKLVKEGPAVDGLAESLIEAITPERREELMADEPDLVDDTLIAALARAAQILAEARKYPAAQAGFERARELASRLGNQKLEGEALQNIANAMYFQRNFEGALRSYEQRLALERVRADDDGVASALLGMATVRYASTEYGPALAAYSEALVVQERIGDEGTIAPTLINRGNVLYLQGEFPGAIADYTRSRAIYKKLQHAGGEADALEGLGRVFVAQGDYAAALEAFNGVLAEAKARNSWRDEGTALLSIGDIHFRLGNLDRARTTLDQSRNRFEATKDPASAGRAWLGLAMTDLVAGRFVLSEDEYRKAAASCATPDDKECVATATVGLAFAQAQQDKFQESIASYKKGIDVFTALSRREQAARAEVGLSQALVGAGQFAAALEAATHARREAESLIHDDLLWRALIAEATSLRRLRERPRAMAAAEAAVAAVDRLRESAPVKPSAPVPRDTSSAFGMLALLQAEAGDAAAAFESAERMRAHDLRLILYSGERDISRGMTDAEREEERTLAGELVSLHAQVSRLKGLPKPDVERIKQLEARTTEATRKRAEQQQRLFERLPALRFWRGLSEPATRTDVRELLTDSDTVLLQFVLGDSGLLAIVARRSDHDSVVFTTHVESAGRRVMAQRVSDLMQPAVLRDAVAWRRDATALVPGLSAVIGRAARAIIIPHEVLWRVPFEALPAGDGYLADSTSVSYAGSVTALVKSPRTMPVSTDQETPSPDLLAVAAPELAASALERIAQTAPDWSIRNAASGEEELKAIVGDADTARIARIEKDAASEASVRDRLSTAGVLHLAPPFRINGASPLFSSMLLAPDAGNDGALEAREVMNLDLHARVAVLSDGGALAMRDAADEVAAVAWAWRAAGVPSLVLRRWASDEAPSNALLAEVHARLRAGDSPDAALQAARTKIRSVTDTSAPFHWSGWMVVGK